MIADPRAEAARVALGLLCAGAEVDRDAARAAWEASDRRADPEPPAAPGRAGSVALSPAAGGERAARVEATRLHYSIDVIPEVMWRIRQGRGLAADEPFEVYRHPWERAGCDRCDRGFIDADEDGSRVVPCPSCRPVRVEGETR